MRRETFTTPAPPRIDVRLAAGEVDVTTGAGAETTVLLEPLNDRGTDAIAKAGVYASGDSVVVEVRIKRAGRPSAHSPSVRVTVGAPNGAGLHVQSASADLVARGRYRAVALKTAAGDVTVDEVDDDLVVSGVSGDVKVRRVGGDAKASTVSGDLRIHEVGGNVHWNTVSGNVEIESIGGAKIDANSVSGDIRLGVRRGASVFLEARTVTGKMTSELEATDGPPADGPTVQLRAQSVSGNVRIVRG